MFYFHLYLGKWSKVTNMFLKGLKPPSTDEFQMFDFYPYLGQWSNLTDMFQLDWFNHQPVKFHCFVPCRMRFQKVKPFFNVKSMDWLAVSKTLWPHNWGHIWKKNSSLLMNKTLPYFIFLSSLSPFKGISLYVSIDVQRIGKQVPHLKSRWIFGKQLPGRFGCREVTTGGGSSDTSRTSLSRYCWWQPEIPRPPHRLDGAKTTVNSEISTTNLNWRVSRISEPSTGFAKHIQYMPSLLFCVFLFMFFLARGWFLAEKKHVPMDPGTSYKKILYPPNCTLSLYQAATWIHRVLYTLGWFLYIHTWIFRLCVKFVPFHTKKTYQFGQNFYISSRCR